MAKLRLKENASLEELDNFYTDVINSNFADVINGDPNVKAFKRSQFNDAISTLAKIKKERTKLASEKTTSKSIKVEFLNSNTISEQERIEQLSSEVDDSLGLSGRNNA